MLSAFTGILWWILYRRSDRLVRLQFEKIGKNDTMINRISSYKSIIRSIGSANNEEIAAEQLKQMFFHINESCHTYYKQNGVSPPKNFKEENRMKNELLYILGILALIEILKKRK